MKGVRYGTSNSGIRSSRHASGERRRDAVAHHLGAEAEPDDAARREPAHVRAVRVGVVGRALELRAGGQQHEPLREERRRVGEVGAVHPAHRAVEGARPRTAVSRVEPQPQVACARAGRAASGCRLTASMPTSGIRVYRSYSGVPRMYITAGAARASAHPTLAHMSTIDTDHRAPARRTHPPAGAPAGHQHPRPPLAGAARTQGRGRRRGRRAHRARSRPSPPAAESSSTPTATRSSTSARASPSRRSATRTRRSSRPCRRRSRSSPTRAS